ncbi:hypothetical protein GZL_06078 [Streptomyces sp. 769]|nr:hypothetical protein GZL_06078 [Streptomyces sp. 769]
MGVRHTSAPRRGRGRPRRRCYARRRGKPGENPSVH